MKKQTIAALFIIPVVSIMVVAGGLFIGVLATMIGADVGTEIVRVLGK